MLPVDLKGWVRRPLYRLLRLPGYMGGLIAAARNFPRMKTGLESAAELALGMCAEMRRGG
jgi:hypothetical protein